MRNFYVVVVLGSCLALTAQAGCSGDDDDGGKAGTAGTGGSGGSGGSDAGAQTLEQCKTAAAGNACSECSCEHCLTELNTCIAEPKCRAVIECVVRTKCTTDCQTACATEVGAIGLADPEFGDLSALATCSQNSCSAACLGNTDGGSDAQTDAPAD